MVKATTLTLLLLLIICGAADGGGLGAACKKTPNADFCEKLLQPYAAQFDGNDAKKIGFTAINATLGQVQACRTFMIREAFKNNTSKGVRDGVMGCVSRIARSEGSLKMAVRELNYTTNVDAQQPKLVHRVDPKKMINLAITELTACLDELKKTGEAGQGALRRTNDSLLACSVANAFVK